MKIKSEITLIVLGVPVAMPRYKRAKSGGVYLPKLEGKPVHPAVQFKSDIRTEAKAQRITMHDGPVKIDWTAYLPRPKRLMRKKDSIEPIPHIGQLDRDNIDKTILDALEGIAYKNDGQVFSGTIEKFYHGKPEHHLNRPHVKIIIKQMEG